MEIILSLVIVGISTALMLKFGTINKPAAHLTSSQKYIRSQSNYQTFLIALSAVILGVLYLTNPSNLLRFLSIGNIVAPAASVPLLGISSQSWLSLGSSLSVFITLITRIFLFIQFRQANINFKQLIPFIPYVLLFSISNSFGEEIIYRLGIIVPLTGKIDPWQIMLLSAIVFGLPHLRGMPNGIVGAIMAGLLGWLLAKSVLETNGIFWAWTIHFLQDVMIFTALVLNALSKETRATKNVGVPIKFD